MRLIMKFNTRDLSKIYCLVTIRAVWVNSLMKDILELHAYSQRYEKSVGYSNLRLSYS